MATQSGAGYTQIMAEQVKIKTQTLRTAVRLHDLVLEPLARAGLLTIDVADLASPGYDVTINTGKLNDLLNNPRAGRSTLKSWPN